MTPRAALRLALALALGPLACADDGEGGASEGSGEASGDAGASASAGSSSTSDAATSASTTMTATTTTGASTGMSSWTGTTSGAATSWTSGGDSSGDATSSGDTTSTSGGVVTTSGDDTTGWATIGDGLSFASEVFPIIKARCSCHKVSYPDAPTTYAALVYKPSMGVPDLTLVVPFDVDASYLLHKLKNTQGEVGGLGVQMPPSNPLSGAELAIFDAWVDEGAAP